jgi:hypothetical protein
MTDPLTEQSKWVSEQVLDLSHLHFIRIIIANPNHPDSALCGQRLSILPIRTVYHFLVLNPSSSSFRVGETSILVLTCFILRLAGVKASF